MNNLRKLLLLNKKAKINADTFLFELRTDAIASKLTKDVDYKQYNYLDSYHNSSECGRNCSEECEIHNGEFGYDKDFEVFDVIDVYELDNLILIKINHYGDEVWTSEFVIVNDEFDLK